MHSKKGQINQVFVYILSAFVIAFVGFVVVKFVVSFTGDAETIAEQKFYDTIEDDYESVYRTYGSQKVLDYKVSNQVSNICFIGNSTCSDTLLVSGDLKSTLGGIYDSGDNIAILDENGILSSGKIGEFEGCFCVKPNNRRISLVLENKKNKVHIHNEP